jgi:lysophospholipase L1-like esterase
MTTKKTIICAVLALTFTGVVARAAAPASDARLRRLVVVGDSLLAGFSSGGFVARGHAGQVDSAPAFVARRAGVSLPQPLMSSPGVPAQLVIDDANGNGRLDPGEVHRTATSIGFRSQPIRVVRNLAVPGEDTQSVFDEIGPGSIAKQLAAGDTVDGRAVLKFLILGIPPRADSVSQLSRAHDLRPTFLLVWIGSNDVLDMATETSPGAAQLDPDEFGSRFSRLLDSLADTGAGMAVANLPDVTGIAALRPAAGEVTSCTQADGSLRPVAADDLLSIDLPRSRLPVPSCADVLGPQERAQVRAKIMAYNAQIAAVIADTEQRRGVEIASVDAFGLFDTLRAQGVDTTGDGVADLTTGYLGGIFSLDGIHPTRTGQAIIANAFIDAINQRFGDAIPRVNVARVASHDPLVDNSFRPSGEPPFGLIGADDTNELAGFFDHVADQVSRGAKDFARDARRTGSHVFSRIRHFFHHLI